MPFNAICPKCSAKVTVKEALIGKSVPCSQCQVPFRVTDPADSTEMDSDIDQDDDLPSRPALANQRSKASRGKSKGSSSSGTSGLWPIAAVVSVFALLLGGLTGYLVTSSRTKAGSAAVQGAGDVSVALSRMLQMLKDGKNREFLRDYAPIEEFHRLQAAESGSSPLPKIPSEILIPVIKGAIGQKAEITSDGKAASFLPASGKLIDPAWQPGPGYEGDVKAVIRSAIAEIEKGDINAFIRNTFPPDALQILFARNLENSAIPLIEKDSALITLMLRDLKDLEKKEAKITEETAEFTLPAIDYPKEQSQLVRPGAEHYSLQPRVIRFSQINGRWRFYNDGSLRKSGMIEGTGTRLQLEQIGSSWRLSRYP